VHFIIVQYVAMKSDRNATAKIKQRKNIKLYGLLDVRGSHIFE